MIAAVVAAADLYRVAVSAGTGSAESVPAETVTATYAPHGRARAESLSGRKSSGRNT